MEQIEQQHLDGVAGGALQLVREQARPVLQQGRQHDLWGIASAKIVRLELTKLCRTAGTWSHTPQATNISHHSMVLSDTVTTLSGSCHCKPC